MSQDTSTETTLTELDRGTPDESLQLLVSMSQHGSISGVGITLTVNGQIVTGSLVGRTGWFDALQETHGEKLNMLTEGLKEVNAALDESDHDLESFEYIHLVNARYLTGAGSYAPSEESRGMFWRGRLSHVSGWSFGTFGPTPPSN